MADAMDQARRAIQTRLHEIEDEARRIKACPDPSG